MTSRTLSELAQLLGARLEGDPSREIDGPANLRDAGPRQISFFVQARYREELQQTRAGAVIVAPDCALDRPDLALLRCQEPDRAFTRVAQLYAAVDPAPVVGVHPSAVVDATAELGPGVSIGPGCVLGPRCRIGARSVLVARVVLGARVEVGESVVLHPGVTCYPGTVIGSRCSVHAGTVIGSDGFGFDPSAEGWTKIPQLGRVVIEDDVEIGANCAIDRGRFDATRIGRGSKLDNQVHVGHNVEVGEHSLLVAQVGISGSARLGRRVILGGQVGVAGHVTIGDGARVAGGSGVFGDLEGGLDYLGYPARPRREALRNMTAGARVAKLQERVGELERELAALRERLEESGGSA